VQGAPSLTHFAAAAAAAVPAGTVVAANDNLDDMAKQYIGK
jgi:hypothetical protein